MINQTCAPALRRSCSILALVASLTLALPAGAFAQAEVQTFEIKAATTAQVLNEFARQSGTQIIFDHDIASQTVARSVSGRLTRQEALSLILAGSRLEIARQTADLIVLKVKGSPAKPEGAGADIHAPVDILEVVVTGTHITGAPATSPARSVSRGDIERSGYGQTGDLVRSLPETFSGGQNPGVLNNPVGSNINLFNASTVNLRGIGSDATLVLLNGHRMASEGPFGGVDISGIPLGAIQNVEIVTDGSSAVYGSDAVAGVVNFVLRKDFDGTEASVRLGDSTQGGGFSQSYSVLSGKTWSAGHALASAEFSRQDAIAFAQRDETAAAPAFNNIIQPYERKSVFIAAGQSLGDRLELSVDAYYNTSDTDQKSQSSFSATANRNGLKVTTWFLAPSARLLLRGDWTARLDTNYARARGSYTIVRSNGTRSMTAMQSVTQYAEVTASGTAFTLPTGAVKLAVGAGYRAEDFNRVSSTLVYPWRTDRNVSYAYGEVPVPVIAPSASRTGLNELLVNLSGRSETYDHFGSASTYKLGVRYVPLPGLAVRATQGTSFKAPLMNLVSSPPGASLYRATTVGGTGTGTVMFKNGGNPDLEPETSENWTFGMDWTSRRDRPLRISLTWFDIEYEDRVVQPVVPYTQALSNPDFAQFVTVNPTLAEQAEALAQAFTFNNNTNGLRYDPANVIALVENRNINAAGQHIYGLDMSVRKSFETGSGDIDLFLNATDLTIDQNTVPGAPTTSISGVLFGPPQGRVRAGATLSRETVTLTGTINHVSGASDTYVTPVEHIGSWTTFDLVLGYRPGWTGALREVEATLAVTNLFDRSPPYARGGGASTTGILFDSTNTTAVGRFISASLKKRF
ncbi:TonB-dependent receptor [Asticcacaulis sp. SL142]|uniref:TonB-dependent receptor n=1 Tax=Asticcacaulis sp. SL142 TaxID=2995155 RepID=UPI00226CA1C4|nr:TonB-dependent receptor [Asticcacaulis sp. SL142]WAC49790.1 TonB-dependent receptor [Asticcacaulis sp. SL142]